MLPTQKTSTRIIFESTVTQCELFRFIIKNYPIPILFVWAAWHYPPKATVLVDFVFITVTRFEVFRIFGQSFHGTWLRLQFGNLSILMIFLVEAPKKERGALSVGLQIGYGFDSFEYSLDSFRVQNWRHAIFPRDRETIILRGCFRMVIFPVSRESNRMSRG